MTDIVRTIEDDDIDFVGPTTGRHYFEHGAALALLLANEVIFPNSHWWKKKGASWPHGKVIEPPNPWPDDAAEAATLFVNCNDVFAWGCADADDLPMSEVENLYRMWRKDPLWGAAVWCIKRTRTWPQGPVERDIRKAGIWDLDDMGLPDRDPYTKACWQPKVFFAHNGETLWWSYVVVPQCA